MFLGCGRGRLRVRGFLPRFFGWGIALGWGTSACNPGDLSDERKDLFRAELEINYPPREEEQPDAGETPAPEPSVETPVATATEAAVATATATSAAPAAVPDCVVTIFASSCAGLACHYSGGLFPPSLERAGLGALLLSEKANCEALERPTYLDKDAPEDSYLLKKISGTQPTSCGSRMPSDGKVLTDDELECMTEWVTQVAQGN